MAVLSRSRSSGDGPVARGLDASLRRAMGGAVAAWQLVMLGAAVVTDTRLPLVVLVVGHLAILGASLLAVAGRLPLLPVVLACYVVWCLDYLACDDIDSALLLAACWFGNLLSAVAGLLFRRFVAFGVPIVGSAVVGAVAYTVRSDWPVDISTAFVVTAAAIVTAAQLALPSLRALADDADVEASRAADDERAQEAARRASREAAEESRLLHDTVVNTLGAVANGIHGDGHVDVVRERCRVDARELRELIAGRGGHDSPTLLGIESQAWGMPVRRTGIVDDELRRQEALLSTAALGAVAGATRELVRNAVKHAGATTVTVEILRDREWLEVAVVDDGVGFEPEVARGRGLDRSVRDRMAVVGGEVVIDSAAGSGTRAVLRCPLATAASTDATVTEPDDTERSVGAIRSRAAWVWSWAVLVVGVVIEAVNRPGRLTATYLMLALVLAAVLLVRVSTRHRPTLPAWVVAVVCGAAAPAFVAGMAGVDYGRTEVVYYQAIGLTPLLVLPLTYAGTGALRVASSVLGLTAAVTAGVLWSSSPDTGVTVLVGAAPALGIAVGFVGFHRLVSTLVGRAASERAVAHRAQIEVAARAEVVAARRRWRGAGLASSLDLLEGIAAQTRDPDDPVVRNECAEEERYLRQLLLLSPEAYRMNEWFARALAESRARDVRLTVRAGEIDAPDERAAAMLGGVVVTAVAEAEPGSEVVAGLFPGGRSARLVVVGAREQLEPVASTTVPASWTVTYSAVGEQGVLEVSTV